MHIKAKDVYAGMHHQGYIKISSGEQFVPLFCAQLLPVFKTGDLSVMYYNDKDTLAYSTIASRWQGREDRSENWKKKFDKLVKKNLVEILDSPVVDKYCLHYGDSTSSGNSIRGFTFSSPEWGRTETASIIGDFGLVTYTSNRRQTIASIRNTFYPGLADYRTDKIVFTPLYLVLIKAKHLKYVRACIYTEKPVTLPYSDIKVVRETYTDNAFKTESPLDDLKQIKVEHLTRAQIVEYLVPPQPKLTQEEFLNRAKMIMNSEEVL